MYIKLGSVNLQYYQETNAWMIMAEVLDSGMSFERPILVRTTEELDIWFGKDFPDYSYMQELLNMGVVLYLYKPISTETTGGDDYIDLDEYTEDSSVWLRDVELDWISSIMVSPEIYKIRYNQDEETIVDKGFKIINGKLTFGDYTEGKKYVTSEIVRTELPDMILKIYNGKIKFGVYNSDNLWIYYEQEQNFSDITLLPQNINLTSSSHNNRDTISISTSDSPFKYTYLDYNEEEDGLGIYKNKDLINNFPALSREYFGEIDMDKVSTGYQTLAFRINGDVSSSDYFVISPSTHGLDYSQWTLVYVDNLNKVPTDVRNMFRNQQRITGKSGLISFFISKGYTNIGGYLCAKTIQPVTNFYSSSATIIPEIEITERVISKYVNPALQFISRTIGRSSKFEDDLIKIIIEEPKKDTYKVIISRYDYVEIFDGIFNGENYEKERLDYIITKNSKLVKCVLTDATEEIKTGTYWLRGAVVEETTPDMYKYSIKSMMSKEYNEPVYPDYFLVPNKYKFTSDIRTQDLYEDFLEYSKEIGCQFLIENKSSDELYNIEEVNEKPKKLVEGTYYKMGDIYYDWNWNVVTDSLFLEIVGNGGDFVYNFKENENRLIYFYKSMTYYYDERPGYYVYLRGLLLGEFSVSVNDVLYKTPTQDAFLDYDIEEVLEDYKSNYLVCDNQSYFYKNYQNGENPVTTGWARFVLGKISRELQKNSGKILGQQLLGKVRSIITDILTSIQDSFSIVNQIDMTKFEPSENGESLNISMNTYVNDLVDNNVSLDITVNYNNNYGTIS